MRSLACDQNQILMKSVARSMAYLHTGEKKVPRMNKAGWLHAPSAAFVVELLSIVVWGIVLHGTTGIAVGINVAVQSDGGAIGHSKKRKMMASAITATTWVRTSR